jgi:hypothetical protein
VDRTQRGHRIREVVGALEVEAPRRPIDGRQATKDVAERHLLPDPGGLEPRPLEADLLEIGVEVDLDREVVTVRRSEVDGRKSPAHQLPVEGKDGGGQPVAVDANVLGLEVPVHERRGCVLERALVPVPAGFHALLEPHHRAEHVAVHLGERSVVEVVPEMVLPREQVLAIALEPGRRQHGGPGNPRAVPVQPPEPVPGEPALLGIERRIGLAADILEEEPPGPIRIPRRAVVERGGDRESRQEVLVAGALELAALGIAMLREDRSHPAVLEQEPIDRGRALFPPHFDPDRVTARGRDPGPRPQCGVAFEGGTIELEGGSGSHGWPLSRTSSSCRGEGSDSECADPWAGGGKRGARRGGRMARGRGRRPSHPARLWTVDYSGCATRLFKGAEFPRALS